jgi:hypothetical protein
MTQIDISRAFLTKKRFYVALGFALLSTAAAGSPEDHTAPTGWRLFHSADPNAPMVSVSRTADVTHSDLDLAGLIFRCSQSGVETLIVVVTPFPPHSRPSVTITANKRDWKFDSDVVTPGTQLLLPAAASILASGPWQLAQELTVNISLQERHFGGVIPLQGIGQALFSLQTACSR